MQLVVGNQRSYSDVCRGETVRKASAGIINYHSDIGLIRCCAGTTLYDVLAAVTEDGWTLPVVPGTGWATVGGCIANDVHGKNHVKVGSFGNHVRGIMMADGAYLVLGDDRFAATVGGLGLTGGIAWADLILERGRAFKPWLFPLDYIPRYWETYKRFGCWQFHCVVNDWQGWVNGVFDCLRQSPLLVVKKHFGNIVPVGMLSFCRPGVSLSFDFARADAAMQARLENAVMAGGGAVYPAKTAMSAEMFQFSFPRWREFAKHVHPDFCSDFWRRVSA